MKFTRTKCTNSLLSDNFPWKELLCFFPSGGRRQILFSFFPLSSQASEYIFKYIIQSRRLFSLATGGQNEEEFRVCIHELFMSIRFFLSQENKGTTPVAQTQVCMGLCEKSVTGMSVS